MLNSDIDGITEKPEDLRADPVDNAQSETFANESVDAFPPLYEDDARRRRSSVKQLCITYHSLVVPIVETAIDNFGGLDAVFEANRHGLQGRFPGEDSLELKKHLIIAVSLCHYKDNARRRLHGLESAVPSDEEVERAVHDILRRGASSHGLELARFIADNQSPENGILEANNTTKQKMNNVA